LGNLSTPKTVQKLQKALHAKAKAEAGYLFYALYDKISREYNLAHAFAQCRSNKGAPGVDGQDFADIDAYGVQRWLGELALALRNETYRPDPIRRVFIPKANGKLRPLGISTLRDRVCMTAAMLVLEPIFEADLPPEQYAYRPGRNAQQAVVEVGALLDQGHQEVVDADLADYFGSIPHSDLLKSVARRVVDRRVLHLIKMWLECAVEETDDRGRKTRTTEARDKRRGIPQGRDAQRPEFAVRLRNEHSSNRIRSVRPLPERKRQFAEPPLHPIRLDVRELLTIHTRCALVGAALGIGMNQDVLAADLVVQGVEAIPGFCLRFRVQRLLQFLNTLRS
jgi:retron-type reverse transcriptase